MLTSGIQPTGIRFLFLVSGTLAGDKTILADSDTNYYHNMSQSQPHVQKALATAMKLFAKWKQLEEEDQWICD